MKEWEINYLILTFIGVCLMLAHSLYYKTRFFKDPVVAAACIIIGPASLALGAFQWGWTLYHTWKNIENEEGAAS